MNKIEQLNNLLYNNIQNLKLDNATIVPQLTDMDICNYRDIYGRKHIYQYFMEIAYKVAERSTCIKRQVGAVIVNNKKIVSQGYNGVSSNRPNCMINTCKLEKNGKCAIYPLHAECNAIMFATPEERKNAIMFITCQPCSACASMISNSGISMVIYDLIHKSEYNVLKQAKIPELQILDAIRQDLYLQEKKARESFKQFYNEI